jgi:protoporphyrinogen oxidase
MSTRSRAVVIGAGPAGLRAAYDLSRQGLEVTVVDGGATIGGLASAFDLGEIRLERYYHFICKGDDDLIATLAELGLGEALRWRRSGMAHFVDGRLYPFLTPLDLLRFRPLTLFDRLRAGLGLLRAKSRCEEELAPQLATEWLRGLFGDAAYRTIWEPLLRFKFASYAPEVSAAWIWARMVRLSRSRSSPWYEELGYIEGGSEVVLAGLARALATSGGRILLGSPVEAIEVADGRAVGVRVSGQSLPADVVVSTVTARALRRLLPPLADSYFENLERIPTIGLYCVLLRLKRAVAPVFWVNTNDRRVPFAGMIEYTNLNPLPQLGGDHILYIPQYVPVEDPRYAEADDAIVARYADALALIQPGFERSWIRRAFVFRDRYAQPVCLTDYRQTTPTITTPIPNLFATDSCQLHPHDRSISGALGLGRRAAGHALAECAPGGRCGA